VTSDQQSRGQLSDALLRSTTTADFAITDSWQSQVIAWLGALDHRAWALLTVPDISEPRWSMTPDAIEIFRSIQWIVTPPLGPLRIEISTDWVTVRGASTELGIRSTIRTPQGVALCTSIGVERIGAARTSHGRRTYKRPPTPEQVETVTSFEVPAEDTKRFANITGAHYPLHQSGGTALDERARPIVQGIVLLINLLSNVTLSDRGAAEMWFREPIRSGSLVDCRQSQSNPELWELANAQTDVPIAVARLASTVTDTLLTGNA
jgi:hypothetical protein